jgi:hypothetical protein
MKRYFVDRTAMSGREHDVADRDQSSVGTAQPRLAMRAHFDSLRGCQILSHPDAGSLVQAAGVAPEIEHNEIDCQLSSVLEPLRTAATGREAVLDMLQRVLSAVPMGAGQNASFLAVLHSNVENDSTQQTSRERRYALRSQILKRLEHSVLEGELPEDADIEALSCLCMSYVSGLAASLQDGIPGASLADSVALFVETVGFHKLRTLKRRTRGSPAVPTPRLTLVKR